MFGFRKHVPRGIMISFFLIKKKQSNHEKLDVARNMFLQFQARQILVDGSDGTCDRQMGKRVKSFVRGLVYQSLPPK